MPAVTWSLSVPANGSANPDLRPYDRLGGNGGAVKVRNTTPLATAANSIVVTMYIGSELITGNGAVWAERAAGAGPDNFTAAIGGLGGPGDPVNITYRNTTAGAIIVQGIMDVDNA